MFEPDTEKQKELFEEFRQPSRKLKFFKANSQSFQNKLFIFQISAEKTVFILLGIVVLVVFTFCFGVERGKRLVIAERSPLVRSLASEQPAKDTAVQPPFIAKPASPKSYSIRIATYLNKESCQKDVDKIKKSGFPAYLAQSGKFFVINVGDYAEKNQADAAFSVLKNKYRDSYIKTNR